MDLSTNIVDNLAKKSSLATSVTIRHLDAIPELSRPTQAELDGMSHAGKKALSSIVRRAGTA